MTPQTGVFPRIHTSYNIYELLIHEMTHDTANEGDPGLVPRSAPTRRRSGAAPGTSPKQTSAVRGAVPGRARNQLERGRNQLGRGLGRAGTTPGAPAAPSPPDGIPGASGPAAPTPNLRRYRTKDHRDRSPARRAVVIGLQPAVNGRGSGLYV